MWALIQLEILDTVLGRKEWSTGQLMPWVIFECTVSYLCNFPCFQSTDSLMQIKCDGRPWREAVEKSKGKHIQVRALQLVFACRYWCSCVKEWFLVKCSWGVLFAVGTTNPLISPLFLPLLFTSHRPIILASSQSVRDHTHHWYKPSLPVPF
jgi:hypothetical protein